MIQGMRVLALIPARGGSKGVKGKNLRTVAGRSLIEWSFRAAQSVKEIDRIVLSSEDPMIQAEARRIGLEVPFDRPKELALDHTPGMDVVLHAIELLPDFDYLVLLQPTSPLRRAEDIRACLTQCIATGAPSAVSVTEASKPPQWTFGMQAGGELKPWFGYESLLKPRQQLPVSYVVNGAIYVGRIKDLRENKSFYVPKTQGFIMPGERAIDIDSEFDLIRAETLAQEQNL